MSISGSQSTLSSNWPFRSQPRLSIFQVPLEFEKALDQFEEKIHQFYPQYEKVIKEFHALADKVDCKFGIRSAFEMASELTQTKLLHGSEDTYLRALNLMHIMVRTLCSFLLKVVS